MYKDILKRNLNIGDYILVYDKIVVEDIIDDYEVNIIALSYIEDYNQCIILYNNERIYNYDKKDIDYFCYKLDGLTESQKEEYISFLKKYPNIKSRDIFNRSLSVGDLVVYFDDSGYKSIPMYGLMMSSKEVFSYDKELRVTSVYLIENFTKEEQKIYNDLVYAYKNVYQH